MQEWTIDKYPREIAYETVWLEQLRLTTKDYLSPSMASSAKFNIYRDLANNMILEMKAYVIAERLPQEHIVESGTKSFWTPSTWWQHFKEQYEDAWWLGWLVSRHPVKYTEQQVTVTVDVNLERFRTYPEARVQLSENDFGRSICVSELRWDKTIR